VTARAATALAAWAGREVVNAEDVRQAAMLALPHRRRRHPFDAPGLDEERLDEAMEDGDEEPDPGPGGPGGDGGSSPGDSGGDRSREPESGPDTGSQQDSAPGSPRDQQPAADQAPGRGEAAGSPRSSASVRDQPPAAPSEPFKARLLQVEGVGTGAEGRRSRARATGGRSVGARPGTRGLHLVATVHAAAPQQVARGRRDGALRLRPEDLREPIREGREGNLVLFVVDASGSMAARQRMAAVKGAILSLLLDAYQRRDKVGLVTFRGRDAEVALPPTWSVEAGAARLASLPTGGRTPLAAGLLQAADVLRVERMRDASRRPLVLVVTDGRATQAAQSKDPLADARRAAAHLHQAVAALDGTAVVVDCEAGPVRLGLAARLAADLGADRLPLADLAADALTAAVHGNRPRSDRRAA
jgi:magnesium chelatase subunit D